MKTRVGVLTSGGDCPGLNAVLRGVVLAAEKLGWEVIGFKDGLRSAPARQYLVLDRAHLRNHAVRRTIIGTTPLGHLLPGCRITGGGGRGGYERAREVLDRLQVRALIIVEGRLATAQQLRMLGSIASECKNDR
jgi:6-phosphofructokinase 1